MGTTSLFTGVIFMMLLPACTFHHPIVGTDGNENPAIVVPYEWRGREVPLETREKGKKEVPQFPRRKANKPVWI